MNLEQAYYELKFENAVLRAKGEEFQTFFERLMGLAYKATSWPAVHGAARTTQSRETLRLPALSPASQRGDLP